VNRRATRVMAGFVRKGAGSLSRGGCLWVVALIPCDCPDSLPWATNRLPVLHPADQPWVESAVGGPAVRLGAEIAGPTARCAAAVAAAPYRAAGGSPCVAVPARAIERLSPWARPPDPAWEPRTSAEERGPFPVRRWTSPQSETWETTICPARGPWQAGQRREPLLGSPDSAAPRGTAAPLAHADRASVSPTGQPAGIAADCLGSSWLRRTETPARNGLALR
jgi:hypothetical protein